MRYVLAHRNFSDHALCTEPHGNLAPRATREPRSSVYLWARKAGGRFILRVEDTDARTQPSCTIRDQLMAGSRAGSGWLWDEGPDIGGPSGPYAQAERSAFYREACSLAWKPAGHVPIRATARPEELELSRKLQRMAGKPPRYAGTCRHLEYGRAAMRSAPDARIEAERYDLVVPRRRQ